MVKNLDKDVNFDPPCHPRACAIQNCLQKSGFQQEKCEKLIDALYECCDAFYKKYGDDGKTVSCPNPSLLRLKIKQRNEAQ